MPPSPLPFFPLSFLIDFFHTVGNRLLIQGKLLRTENLLFTLRYFKKLSSWPTTPAVGSVTQHAYLNMSLLSQKINPMPQTI